MKDGWHESVSTHTSPPGTTGPGTGTKRTFMKGRVYVYDPEYDVKNQQMKLLESHHYFQKS